VKVRPAIVIVPVRGRRGGVTASTLNVTVPLPVPLALDVMVIHESLLTAVQPQPPVAVIVIVPLPPSFSTLKLVGLMANAHPACETVNVCPAMVSVVEREPPVLGATSKPTAPFPVPLEPEVTDTHEAVLVAVHVQPVAVEIVIVPLPPSFSTLKLVGVMANAHPACETVNVCPAMVSVVEREPPVLRATSNPTAPFPVPLEPEVTDTHEALLFAVHAQPVAVVTATGDPGPPSTPIVCEVGAIE
jgi:hypothetical protein